MLLLVQAPGCVPPGDDSEAICPMMDCPDQARFAFMGGTYDSYSGTIVADGVTTTFTCTGTTLESDTDLPILCDSDGFDVNQKVDAFDVSVNCGYETYVGTFTPEWVPEMPGGEECGVYCYTVELVLQPLQ
jgi:hypothetical protein